MTHRIVAIDDAFISYRYAENLLSSGQLVFNSGERVEGATNLLWILVLAGLKFVSGFRLEVLSISASLLLLLFTQARCAVLLRQIGLKFWPILVALLIVFGTGDVFLTVTNGLEASLYAALLTEALAAVYTGRRIILGVTIGLLFMTRPEGALVGLIILGAFWNQFSDRRKVAQVTLPFVALVFGTTLFRVVYFGSWLPNSIIAKSFPLAMLPYVVRNNSIPYLFDFAKSTPNLFIILCLSIYLISFLLRQFPQIRLLQLKSIDCYISHHNYVLHNSIKEWR